MRTSEVRDIMVEISHQDILAWAISKAKGEIQTVLGTKPINEKAIEVTIKYEKAASLDPAYKGPSHSATIRVNYKEGVNHG